MRVLITGYGGFAGGHLADHLLADTDWRVWGAVYRRADASTRVGRLREPEGIVIGDLKDPECVRDHIRQVRPDVVFHLAAQASVAASWRDPWSTFESNVRMTVNLLQAAAEHARASNAARTRVVVVSSNEVYGVPPEHRLPTAEDAPIDPRNPYATSKVAADLVARQLGDASEVEVIRIRPFTHFGPGQDPRFVAASFAKQIAEIEAGMREPVVRVGNLSARRDMTDVRDIVRGYRLAAERGSPGRAYNLGSGAARAVREILDGLIERARVAVRVEQDPERMRPTDTPITLCDASRALRDLGWRPEIAFSRTLDDVLADWRKRTEHPSPSGPSS